VRLPSRHAVVVLAFINLTLAAPSVVGSAPATAKAPLVCTLQLPDKPRPGQPLLLKFSLRNDGPHALSVLVWATPLEPRAWMGAYVSVTRNGVPLTYGGASVKRGDPDAGAYLRLAPGETRQGEVDMALAFDLSQPGRYDVAPHIVLHDVVNDGEQVPRSRAQHIRMPLRCNPLSFKL
jgi:peptidyl-Lys metalloendopeptidase